MKKLFCIPFLFLVFCLNAKAQQEMLFSQYMFSQQILNPAYVGSNENPNTNLLHRHQWTQFESHPSSSYLAFEFPIVPHKNGAGAVLSYDELGVSKQWDLFMDYAYHLPFLKGHLSFGLSGGISVYSADLQELIFWDEDDEVFAKNIESTVLPQFGAGLYHYSDNYFMGFSIPHLLSYDSEDFFSASFDQAPNTVRHYYLYGGYVFNLKEYLDLKPTLLLKHTQNTPLNLDLSLSAFIKKTLWLGLSYRTSGDWATLIGFQTGPHWRIGYSYDFNSDPIGLYSQGSHEVSLGYTFVPEDIKIKTPRYF